MKQILDLCYQMATPNVGDGRILGEKNRTSLLAFEQDLGSSLSPYARSMHGSKWCNSHVMVSGRPSWWPRWNQRVSSRTVAKSRKWWLLGWYLQVCGRPWLSKVDGGWGHSLETPYLLVRILETPKSMEQAHGQRKTRKTHDCHDGIRAHSSWLSALAAVTRALNPAFADALWCKFSAECRGSLEGVLHRGPLGTHLDTTDQFAKSCRWGGSPVTAIACLT